MRDLTGSGGTDVVGDDRDTGAIVESLRRGVSIVLAGPLGSGKTHLIRHLIEELTAREERPLLLRSGGALSLAPLGALGASSDPRAALLRDGQPAGDGRLIVVIDDTQDLDAPSAAAVVRAVYSGHATALFALRVSRDGSPRPVAGGPDAGQMAVELWLRGLAERVDLAALTPPDADHLLDVLATPELDALTRASIIALADGSRRLLRELAREAAQAIRLGQDPLAALRDNAPRGRLSDALGAHVSQLSGVEQTTLAVLGRVPRIGRADAARFMSPSIVDGLVFARLVHDDGTPARRLAANPALAREAYRRSGPDAVDAVLHAAMERMLSPTSEWWCEPLAVLTAQSWLHHSPLGPIYDDVAPEIRARVALAAARRANDDGEGALAIAHARLGMQNGEVRELMLEVHYAEALQGGMIDLGALVDSLAGEPVGSDTLLRCIRIATLAGAGDAVALTAATERLGTLACSDARAEAELALFRAQCQAVAMEWSAAVAAAEKLFIQPGGSPSLRMRAAVWCGIGHTCLGSWEQGQAWFLRAHRCAGERGGISPITTSERLWGLTIEIQAAALSGVDLAPSLARLGGEVDAAAREGDAETSALVGLVAASAYAMVGEPTQSARELEAATRRARHPAVAAWIPFATIAVARALALSDRPDEARAVLDRVDPATITGVPALAHACMLAESYVSAAHGRWADALASAQAAADVSGSAPTVRARDLYQLVALGRPEEGTRELRRLAESSDVPSTRLLTDMASALVETPAVTDTERMDSLRRGAAWDHHREEGLGLRAVRVGGHTHTPETARRNPATADLELTRREKEIALLIADGLGNREIAQRLYLSVRTVESHVYQARAKLGLPSRAELGRTVRQPVRPHTDQRLRTG